MYYCNQLNIRFFARYLRFTIHGSNGLTLFACVDCVFWYGKKRSSTGPPWHGDVFTSKEIWIQWEGHHIDGDLASNNGIIMENHGIWCDLYNTRYPSVSSNMVCWKYYFRDGFSLIKRKMFNCHVWVLEGIMGNQGTTNRDTWDFKDGNIETCNIMIHHVSKNNQDDMGYHWNYIL